MMNRSINAGASERGNTSDQGCDFDDAVIGSSPLMLLVALDLAESGRQVCVLDRNRQLGGSWESTTVGNAIDVEIACHLIEVFPGVYEYLEAVSGVPFDELKEQPIRIHPSGLQVGYFSRAMLLVSGVRLAYGYIASNILDRLSLLKDQNQRLNYKTKFRSFLYHQAACLFRKNPLMKAPRHGFVDFMNRLEERCIAAGVSILTLDVHEAVRHDIGWKLADSAEAKVVVASRVHCTTSTNLKRVGDGHFQAVEQQFARRAAMLVEVPRDRVVVSQTYVAFWKDPSVARISRIDEPEGPQSGVRFLVEFRNESVAEQPEIEKLVLNKLSVAKIVDDLSCVKFVGRVDCLSTNNTDQLPDREIENDFFGYFSMGNLAAGIADWLSTGKVTVHQAGATEDAPAIAKSAA